jgi:hypothetical protein
VTEAVNISGVPESDAQIRRPSQDLEILLLSLGKTIKRGHPHGSESNWFLSTHISRGHVTCGDFDTGFTQFAGWVTRSWHSGKHTWFQMGVL